MGSRTPRILPIVAAAERDVDEVSRNGAGVGAARAMVGRSSRRGVRENIIFCYLVSSVKVVRVEGVKMGNLGKKYLFILDCGSTFLRCLRQSGDMI
jgi:hypothetical protein